MNKTELINSIASKSGLSKKTVKLLWTLLSHLLKKHLERWQSSTRWFRHFRS